MSKKILIVDDDPDFVAMNKAVLESNGYVVRTTNTGRDGVGIIPEFRPDLVLLDVMMDSDVSGFDAVDEIRKLPDFRELPILMITSFDEYHKTPWAEKPSKDWVDVCDYLRKPVSPEKLLEEVAKYVA